MKSQSSHLVAVALVVLAFAGRAVRADDRAGDVAAFSPDGRAVVTIDVHGDANLTEIASGRRLATFRIRANTWLNSRAMWFSADGRLLAVWQRAAKARDDLPIQYEAVQVWDVSTLKQRHALMDAQFRGFSPDGKSIAVLQSGRKLVIIDTDTGRPRATLEGLPEAQVPFRDIERVQVVFSRDGRTLATADPGGGVVLWDAGTGRPRVTLLENKSPEALRLSPMSFQSGLAFSPDGKVLAVARHDRLLGLFDVESGKQEGQLDVWTDHVPMFAPDGRTLLVASSAAKGARDNELTLWDLQTKQKRLRIPSSRPFREVAAFSPDGTTLATATGDKASPVILWDMPTGKEREKLESPNRDLDVLKFTPDGRGLLAAAALEGPNVASGEILRWNEGRGWMAVELRVADDTGPSTRPGE